MEGRGGRLLLSKPWRERLVSVMYYLLENGGQVVPFAAALCSNPPLEVTGEGRLSIPLPGPSPGPHHRSPPTASPTPRISRDWPWCWSPLGLGSGEQGCAGSCCWIGSQCGHPSGRDRAWCDSDLSSHIHSSCESVSLAEDPHVCE